MMKTTHRLFGAWTVVGAGSLPLLHWQPGQILVGAGVAAIFAAGRTSPDADQYKLWKKVDKWIPDELLGHGGPLGHRRLSHWWGLPAMVAVAIAAGQVAYHAPFWWIAWSALFGWISHLVGDFIFGKACWQDGRGPGIPLAPWWCHVGLGFDTGGWFEALARFSMLVAPAPLLYVTHH